MKMRLGHIIGAAFLTSLALIMPQLGNGQSPKNTSSTTIQAYPWRLDSKVKLGVTVPSVTPSRVIKRPVSTPGIKITSAPCATWEKELNAAKGTPQCPEVALKYKQSGCPAALIFDVEKFCAQAEPPVQATDPEKCKSLLSTLNAAGGRNASNCRDLVGQITAANCYQQMQNAAYNITADRYCGQGECQQLLGQLNGSGGRNSSNCWELVSQMTTKNCYELMQNAVYNISASVYCGQGDCQSLYNQLMSSGGRSSPYCRDLAGQMATKGCYRLTQNASYNISANTYCGGGECQAIYSQLMSAGGGSASNCRDLVGQMSAKNCYPVTQNPVYNINEETYCGAGECKKLLNELTTTSDTNRCLAIVQEIQQKSCYQLTQNASYNISDAGAYCSGAPLP